MGECYLGGASGKKTASGTFVGDGTATHNVSLDFTPKFVSVIARRTEEAPTTEMIYSINYDFETGYGWAYEYTFMGNKGTYNLKYASDFRPTFSGGVLTLRINELSKFYSGYTYEWFASE